MAVAVSVCIPIGDDGNELEWKHKENSADNIRIVDNLLSDSQLYG